MRVVEPPSQNCFSCDDYFSVVGVVDVHFFAIKNCDVACCGEFGDAEKGIFVDGWDDVHIFCRLADVVVQVLDFTGRCSQSVGQLEHLG